MGVDPTKYVSKKILPKRPTLNLPPGPWKLPVIGSIHHLIASKLPHRTLRDLAKKHGPLMHLQLGEIPTIVISSPRVAQEVLKTHDIAFTNRPELLSIKIVSYNYSDVAFAPYGNYWRQMRKLCTLELLSAKNVLSFASIREEEAFNLVQYVESKSGSVINLTEEIYALTNAVICRAAFGKRRKEESAYFMSLIKELSLMITGPTNVELPLAQLIYYFNWKLPNGMEPEDVDVTETSGTTGSRKCNLYVIATCNDHEI